MHLFFLFSNGISSFTGASPCPCGPRLKPDIILISEFGPSYGTCYPMHIMSCENHPDKPRFRNDQHRAVVNILYTCNNIASRLQQMLNGHNLTLQQFNILRILERQYPEPSCNCNIRKQMLDARSDITRIVDRLIKENLVIRTQCSSDRRKVNISLTGKGLEVLGSLEEMNEKMDRIMNILSSSELKELNTLLDKIRGSNRG